MKHYWSLGLAAAIPQCGSSSASHQALQPCAALPAVRRQLGSKRVWQPRLAALNVAQQLELVGPREGGPAHHLWAGTGETGKEVAVGSGGQRRRADIPGNASHQTVCSPSLPTGAPCRPALCSQQHSQPHSQHPPARTGWPRWTTGLPWHRTCGSAGSRGPCTAGCRTASQPGPVERRGSQAANRIMSMTAAVGPQPKHKQACSRPGVRADHKARQPNPHARTCGCRLRANPKSAILSVALAEASDSSRFCGFRSRCGRHGEEGRGCRSAGCIGQQAAAAAGKTGLTAQSWLQSGRL